MDLSSPKKTLLLVKIGVSGELTYLAVFSSPDRTAPAEADHPPLLVADGEHQPSAEAVVVAVAVLLAQDEARLLDQRQFVAFAFGPVDRVVPEVRRVAEAEELHRFGGHAAFGEVIAGDLAGGFIGQGALPALGDLLVDLQQPFLEMPRLLLAGVLLILQRNLGPVGQPPHRLGESQCSRIP